MTQQQREALIKKLADEGKLVETGWMSMRITCVPEDAPEVQLIEMRNAFFAGAQHVFASMINMMDPGTEPTAKDFQRMHSLHNELTEFIEQYKIKHTNYSGQA